MSNDLKKIRLSKLLQGGTLAMGMVLITGSAYAQDWSPNCGQEPQAPVSNVSTIENYNNSVDRFKSYEKAARTYNSCVAKQANQKQTSISQKARDEMEAIQKVSVGVHNRIAANFTKIQGELKTAAKKLSPKK